MKILNILASGNLGGIEKLNIDIYRNSKHEHIYYFMFKEGKFTDALRTQNAFVEVADFKFKHNFIAQYMKLETIVKKCCIDAIIVHHETPFAWVIGSLLGKKYSIPFYIYAHSNINEILMLNRKMKCVYKKLTFCFALRQAKNIIAISKFVCDSICNKFPDIKDKTIVIYNGIDVDAYSIPKAICKSSNDKIKCIFVGRLVKEKGVDLLINTLKMIKRIELECIIVGDGAERKNLEELSKKIGIENKIFFTGKTMNTAFWLHTADFYVHPAICEEGFGISLIEAMAARLPCIAFKKGAIPEIIKNNVNGYIVKEPNEKALAMAIEKMIDVIQNQSLVLKEMKLNAYKTAKRFSIKSMVTLLDKLLES